MHELAAAEHIQQIRRFYRNHQFFNCFEYKSWYKRHLGSDSILHVTDTRQRILLKVSFISIESRTNLFDKKWQNSSMKSRQTWNRCTIPQFYLGKRSRFEQMLHICRVNHRHNIINIHKIITFASYLNANALHNAHCTSIYALAFAYAYWNSVARFVYDLDVFYYYYCHCHCHCYFYLSLFFVVWNILANTMFHWNLLFASIQKHSICTMLRNRSECAKIIVVCSCVKCSF